MLILQVIRPCASGMEWVGETNRNSSACIHLSLFRLLSGDIRGLGRKHFIVKSLFSLMMLLRKSNGKQKERRFAGDG